jgi:phosphohistidine swiveling domain-containing protein
LEVFFQAGAILKKNLFPKIARSLGLSVNDLRYFYYWEISDGLTGKKIKISEILARKRGYGILANGNNVQSLSAIEVKDLEKKIVSKKYLSRQILGNTACRGKVTGIAKIIISPKEFSKFKAGDILVTAMTTPDYVPIMKKAAAFVTDEGGISCHAAIVAREMHKPCVIGTKIATKILRDGDRVEVNADKGIINILRRK